MENIFTNGRAHSTHVGNICWKDAIQINAKRNIQHTRVVPFVMNGSTFLTSNLGWKPKIGKGDILIKIY